MSGAPGSEKLSSTDLYFVLIGRVGRCTIWPCCAQMPVGWRVVFGPDTHARCAAYVERHRGDKPAPIGHHRRAC
jgi:MbtH protein